MLYACLATFCCLLIGLLGLAVSVIDIERFNFGLYLALLSVVGCTVSIAFWIIAPAACANPQWLQRLTARYGYKLDPIRLFFRRHFGKKHRRRRNRSSSKTKKSRASRVLLALNRGNKDKDTTDESRSARRDTDATSRDTITVPSVPPDNPTNPLEEEEGEDESSAEEEADYSPLIASSLASFLAPTLATTRSIGRQKPFVAVALPSPKLDRIGELSYEGPGQDIPSIDNDNEDNGRQEVEDDVFNPLDDEILAVVVRSHRRVSEVPSRLRTVLQGIKRSTSASDGIKDYGSSDDVV